MEIQNVNLEETKIVSLVNNSSNLSKYKTEDIEKAKKLALKINPTDVNSIVNFGVDLQSNLNSYSNDIINNIKSGDSGEIGEIINDLLQDINYIDVDPSKNNGIVKFVRQVPILNKLVKKAEKMISRYEKVSKNVDDVIYKLDESRMTLIKDNTTLQNMRLKQEEFIKEVHSHIIAAEIKANEIQNDINNYEKIDENDYTLADKKSFLNRLEKKINDLVLTKTIAIQSIPQIRIIQENNSVIVEKIQSTVTNTIPLWKNMLSVSIALEKQRKTLEMQKKVSETTNKILLKNSELLKQNSIEAAKQNEEAIINPENIAKVNQDLISTLDEILRIQEEGKRKRSEIRKQTEEQEKILIDKILTTKDNSKMLK
jgi:uncharacterized protein YaaN involved in tellurite resistance